MINIIWFIFIFIGISYGIVTGNVEKINGEILDSAKTSFDMIINMLPIITLWVGIMEIAKSSGLLDKLAKLLSPVLSFLFPEIPKNHESLEYISSNIIVNLFGLGNAATPFGIKAMKSLQELNSKKDTATRSMITFLVLNTSGLSIIPTTVISLRMMHKSINPTEIILPVFVATLITTIFALALDRTIGGRK